MIARRKHRYSPICKCQSCSDAWNRLVIKMFKCCMLNEGVRCGRSAARISLSGQGICRYHIVSAKKTGLL